MTYKPGAIKALLLCGAALSGLALNTESWAQASSSQISALPNPDLQEIVVTATKRYEKIHDVGGAITAVTGADMQLRQQLDFKDFAAQVPGFEVESAGQAGWNREILRGQNSGGSGATVATVIDDMPLSFSGSANDGGLQSTNPDTYDLSRVEVLKGPQGTLYGATAEGGVIKFVTNPPDTQAFHAGAEIGGDSVDHGDYGGSVKGYLNVPFWDGKAAVRLTGFYEDIPGYIDDPYLNEHDVNRSYKAGFRASLLVKPIDDLTIRVTVSQQYVHSFGFDEEQVYGTALGNAQANRLQLVNGYSYSTYFNQPGENIIPYYIVNANYDLHWANLTSITSFGQVKNHFYEDRTSGVIAPGVEYGAYIGSLLGVPNVGLQQNQDESLSKFNQEFRLSSEPNSTLFGHKFDWVGGIYLTREDVKFDQLFDFFDNPTASSSGPLITNPPAGGLIGPSRYEEAALFGQLDYYLTNSIDVAVGGRVAYDEQQLTLTYLCCGVEGGGAALPINKSHEQPNTWSVAPRWHITDTTLAYLRVATGYRPGGPNFVPLGAPPAYKDYYGPDSTTNYEVGLRTELLDRSVSIDVSAFYIDWRNIQITSIFIAPNGVAYGATGNGGSAVSEGIEYNLAWVPFHGFSLGLIGAYTDAHLTASAPGLGATSGQDLAYVPRWSSTFNADYNFPLFNGYNGFVGGSVTYTGSRYTDFGTSATDDPHILLPSYTTLALQAGIKKGQFTFEAYSKNVTNARGISSYDGEGGFGLTGVASLITPRVIGLRVAVDY
jgi:iron complex outermembrane recepter protein